MDENAEGKGLVRKHSGASASEARSGPEPVGTDAAAGNGHPLAEPDVAKEQGETRGQTGDASRSRAQKRRGRNGPTAQILAGIRAGGAAVDLGVYIVPALAVAWLACRASGVGAGVPEDSSSGVWSMAAVVACSVLGAIGPDMGMQRGLGAHISGRRGRYAWSVLHSQGYRAELTHNVGAAVAVGIVAAPLMVYGRTGIAAGAALFGSYCLHLLVDGLSGRQKVTAVPGGLRARNSEEQAESPDDDCSFRRDWASGGSAGQGQNSYEADGGEPEGPDEAVSVSGKAR